MLREIVPHLFRDIGHRFVGAFPKAIRHHRANPPKRLVISLARWGWRTIRRGLLVLLLVFAGFAVLIVANNNISVRSVTSEQFMAQLDQATERGTA